VRIRLSALTVVAARDTPATRFRVKMRVLASAAGRTCCIEAKKVTMNKSSLVQWLITLSTLRERIEEAHVGYQRSAPVMAMAVFTVTVPLESGY
jgi:hypothetical protein